MKKNEIVAVLCVEGALLLIATFFAARAFYAEEFIWSSVYFLVVIYVGASLEMTLDRLKKLNQK